MNQRNGQRALKKNVDGLFSTTPRYTTPHHTTSHHITSHHTTPHHTTLHYTTPHHTTLHYTTLHYTLPDTESEPMTGISLAADHSFEEVSGAMKEVYLVGILT